MGVPKFFRWLSERYPICSQLITESHVPEFDNLYLDMNGIIHNCSHSSDPSRDSYKEESSIFNDIFNYIDFLFCKIQPKKLFYLAIDGAFLLRYLSFVGVAPRAKMNQQRSRRFRAAKEAADAVKKMQISPNNQKQEFFDSNCITPGTVFMERLSLHLRYFLHKKISSDPLWNAAVSNGLQIILSPSSVPGEGEHKIMEYIREMQHANGSAPLNLRHCFYGLDADLIMLGLATHEQYTSLLREEVIFGGAAKGKRKFNSNYTRNIATSEIESTKFYLLHLNLLREYFKMDFKSIATASEKKTEFLLNRVIDDFVLFSILIGNDFLPPISGLSIENDAFFVLFEAYRKVFPRMSGYLTCDGIINMDNLQIYLNELAKWEFDGFQSSLGHHVTVGNKTSVKGKGKQKLSLPEEESSVVSNVLKTSIDEIGRFIEDDSVLSMVVSNSCELSQIEIGKIQLLCDKLYLEFLFNVDHTITITKFPWNSVTRQEEENVDFQIAHVGIDHDFSGTDDSDAISDSFVDEDEEEDESRAADAKRLFKIIAHENNIYSLSDDEKIQHEDKNKMAEKNNLEMLFNDFKLEYYMNKLNLSNPESAVSSYIEGLQWVLGYYFKGVVSWPWFYPYHYGPKLSDLVNISKYKVSEWTYGAPFKPFEQLMAVLPARSKALVPQPFHKLMTDNSSPIIHFYPSTFEIDMNGKRNAWEGIVLVPFIEEKLLLNAMKSVESLLTDEEKKRNTHGLAFHYSLGKISKQFPSPDINSSSVFPVLENCLTKEIEFKYKFKSKRQSTSTPDSSSLNVSFPGFPSFKYINQKNNWNHSLEIVPVDLFRMPSTKPSMLITVTSTDKSIMSSVFSELSAAKQAPVVFVNWPCVIEAKFLSASCKNGFVQVASAAIQSHTAASYEQWRILVAKTYSYYKTKMAIDLGNDFETIAFVQTFKGMAFHTDGSTHKKYSTEIICVPAKTLIIPKTEAEKASLMDQRYNERSPLSLSEKFPIGSKAILIAKKGSILHNYGSVVTVQNVFEQEERVLVAINDSNQKNEIALKIKEIISEVLQENQIKYFASSEVARKLKITPLFLSKITSKFLIFLSESNNDDKHNDEEIGRYHQTQVQQHQLSVDIGLNWKFESKGIALLGFTRKSPQQHQGISGGWVYSEKAVELLQDYLCTFKDVFEQLYKLERSRLVCISALNEVNPSRIRLMKNHVRKLMMEANQEGERSSSNRYYSINCTNGMLNKDQVQKLSAEIDKLKMDYDDEERAVIKKIISKKVPGSFLLPETNAAMYLACSLAKSRKQGRQFNLGDRVMILGNSSSELVSNTTFIPRNSHGTVIGSFEDKMNKKMEGDGLLFVYVLLDKSIHGVGSLSGLCPDGRGAAINANLLLNISTIDLTETSKGKGKSSRNSASEKGSLPNSKAAEEESKQTSCSAPKVQVSSGDLNVEQSKYLQSLMACKSASDNQTSIEPVAVIQSFTKEKCMTINTTTHENPVPFSSSINNGSQSTYLKSLITDKQKEKEESQISSVPNSATKPLRADAVCFTPLSVLKKSKIKKP